jgi:CheY-like chemotaxis protein
MRKGPLARTTTCPLWRIDCTVSLQTPVHTSTFPPTSAPSSTPESRRFRDAPTLRKQVPTWEGDPPCVLIVEDNEEQRIVYEESLESLGYEVVCASSGEEALRLASARRPAVVVMDVSLGSMDGIEAMRLLKANPETGGAAVIIATSHGDDAFDDARRAGCDAFICKPVNPFTLDEVIRALVKGGSHRPAPERVSGFDCARVLALVGFVLTAAEAPSATLERDGVTLFVPLVPQLSAKVLDTILRAADLPPARFAALLERFGG